MAWRVAREPSTQSRLDFVAPERCTNPGASWRLFGRWRVVRRRRSQQERRGGLVGPTDATEHRRRAQCQRRRGPWRQIMNKREEEVLNDD